MKDATKKVATFLLVSMFGLVVYSSVAPTPSPAVAKTDTEQSNPFNDVVEEPTTTETEQLAKADALKTPDFESQQPTQPNQELLQAMKDLSAQFASLQQTTQANQLAVSDLQDTLQDTRAELADSRREYASLAARLAEPVRQPARMPTMAPNSTLAAKAGNRPIFSGKLFNGRLRNRAACGLFRGC